MIITYQDHQGTSRDVEAESLEGLARALTEADYDGPSVAVRDEQGSIRGWVRAGDWRAA